MVTKDSNHIKHYVGLTTPQFEVLLNNNGKSCDWNAFQPVCGTVTGTSFTVLVLDVRLSAFLSCKILASRHLPLSIQQSRMCRTVPALKTVLHTYEHREPEHLIRDENKCTVIYLYPCVFFSRLEGIWMKWRRFTNYIFRILSCVPLCNHDAQITSQVSGNVVKYQLSSGEWFSDKGWNSPSPFV